MNKKGKRELKSYCLFCKSGSESSVANTINSLHKDLLAIAPQRVVQERRNDKWEQRNLALLPGYVFLFVAREQSGKYRHVKVTDMYKFLQYEGGIKELEHEDHTYAMWIHKNHGKISPSKVLTDGDAIRVIDGPLLECQGKIIRLDKHKRRALVEFDFDGQKRLISLSADCVVNKLKTDMNIVNCS